MTAPAVFLDRDGVLNRNVFNPATRAWEAPHHPDDFVLTPGALPALARLAAGGFRLFVVSNQPDYALGKASLEAIAAIHHRLAAQLTAAHVEVDAFYYCYHHPRGIVPGYSGDCACRKPSPYFLFQAHDSYGIELAASWMVGDRASDIACGRAAGVRTIRIAPAIRRQLRRGKPKTARNQPILRLMTSRPQPISFCGKLFTRASNRRRRQRRKTF